MATVSSPEFWNTLYAHHGDGWELGQPTPALVDFVESTPPPRGRVAVPGCGRAHDVRYLARRGYDAVGFDFSDAAVVEARALARAEGSTAPIEQRDIFTLARDHANAFEGLWEYTCFCAIDPARRAEYVRVVDAILKPGGWLLACFYPVRAYGAGPPFPVRREEVARLFTPPFRIERAFVPLRSVSRRQGQEWMVLARKVAAPA
ncbi:MAG: methyltransferase domain-containing protein [Candidatus Rokubacteria bacterium]|nr:methyltransferase domain-containing protein [Candidatus Rokubacteria bacterium]MBI3825211.1 methyltransferase domain-containing protein [Candidatus Rokubacteria bacterium]